MRRILLAVCVIVSTLQVVSVEKNILQDMHALESALSHTKAQVGQLQKYAALFSGMASSLESTGATLSSMQTGLEDTHGSLKTMFSATTAIHGHISSITRSTEKITVSTKKLDSIMQNYQVLSVELQKQSQLTFETIKKLEELSTSLQDEFKGIVTEMKRPGVQKLIESLKKQEKK